MSSTSRFWSAVFTLVLLRMLVPVTSSAVTSIIMPDHPPNAVATPKQKVATQPSHITPIVLNGSGSSEAYGRLPLSFEANQGQIDSQVKFLSRGSGYSLYLTSTEAVLALGQPANHKGRENSLATSQIGDPRTSEPPAVLRMKLVGANLEAEIEGQDELPGKSHYFIGNEPEKWRTNISHYARVKYRNVYPGIDLIYYGNQRQLEYDLVVAPGADPGRIKFAFAGAHNVHIDGRGELVLRIADSEIRQHKPVIYQEVDGVRQDIAGGYVIDGRDHVGFQVAVYDHTKPLVIDPTLVYSTLIGGSGYDFAFGIAVGASGSAYITGSTLTSDFPTANPYQATGPAGNGTMFVTKLNPEGTGLVYSTYFGSSAIGLGIAVDGFGSAYVTGFGGSIPTTPGAFQATDPRSPQCGGAAAFVTKLNPAGSALIYSTYLGGLCNSTEAHAIALDASGNAYVTGFTYTDDFPTVNAVQARHAVDPHPYYDSGKDAFVTKLNATGSALIYSTFLGGSNRDEGLGIAVDSSGRAYVTGSTNSSDFPTVNAFQSTYGGGTPPFGGNNPLPGDVFVARFAVDGSLEYSTYLGGSQSEMANGIAVDASGSAYVTGASAFSGFPTTAGAFQPNPGGAWNAFVTKLAPSGAALIYSTYLGGGSVGQSIAVDGLGNAYVTGVTDSTDFPILNAFQERNAGSWEAFVTKLNAAGSALVYSTFLGGTGGENFSNNYTYGLPHIAVDDAGRAYVAGWTNSLDFPTSPDAFQRALHGGSGAIDAFVVKVGAGAAGTGLSLEAIAPNHGGNSGAVTARVHGAGFVSGTTITLARSGQADILADPMTVEKDGDLATAPFDLRGGVPGLWDVVATNPDGTSTRLRDAFTVEAGGKPIIWTDIVGPKAILKGSPVTYTVVVGNRGNTDALGVMLFIGGLPRDATVQPRFEIALSPGLDPSIDWRQYSPYVADHVDANAQMLPVFVPIVAAGQSVPFRITLSVPTSRFGTLRASAGGPVFEIVPTEAANRIPSTYGATSGTTMVGTVCDAGSVASDVYSCLTSLPFPPGVGCVIGLGDLIKQAYCAANSGDTLGQQAVGLAWPAAQAILGCSDLGLSKALESAYAGVGVASSCLSGLGHALNYFCGTSFDPNDKVGSDGVGAQHYVTGEEPLRYMIFFENKPDATAPAHQVVITDQLDSNLDLTTFQPGAVAFGERQAFLQPDGSQFSAAVDLRPEKNLLVRIGASLNPTSRVLSWRFTSIDPATGEMPEDAQAGFLPPNKIAPEGNGNVFFTIMAKTGVATGTEIRNRASIIFDFNDSIDTPTSLNTIDNTKPTSHVTSVGPPGPEGLPIQWSGSDIGAGIQDYTIFVSENDGPFTGWLANTSATTGTFVGSCGKSYRFYSIARDLAGNVEDPPTTPDATVALDVCDLAITDINAPANVDISKKNPVTRPVTVQIQNRSPHPEIIPDAAALAKLVTLNVQSLGACPAPQAVLRPQLIGRLPLTLKTKQKLSVPFDVTFDCANDPGNSTAKTPGHDDFRVSASLDHSALGTADAHPDDDVCPRSVPPPGVIDPYPDGKILDKGCGTRKPDGTLGGAIVIDVIKKP